MIANKCNLLTSSISKTRFRYASYSSSCSLKDVLKDLILKERDKMMTLKCQHGNKKIGEISVNSVLGGMRGLPLLLCNTSYVDPKMGIYYGDALLKDVVKKLPKVDGAKEGSPEGAFWLLTAGTLPTKEQLDGIKNEWNDRGKVPKYCINLLDSLDKRIHPMAQLSAAITCLSSESKFQKAYAKGVKKPKYWESIYEDCMNLCAVLPTVAAIIYRNIYRDEKGSRKLNKDQDWSMNFCRMLGFDDPKFVDFMRLYLTIHADHESGNVSAHTCHLVGSALSDPYLSYAAGMNGLAGPLHGLACQEVLDWLEQLQKKYGDEPKDEDLIKYVVEDTLGKGKVIPGYGHAVLRDVDPRFTIQHEFAKKNCKDDVGVKLVARLFKILPIELKKLGKVSNPYPNVDAHSGVLMKHYCITEMQYFTVLFGVSRALGVLSQMIWARALGSPIERPKSITTKLLCQLLNKK